MRSRIKLLPVFAALTLLVWGCQKENNNGNDPDAGEKTTVSLIVSTNQSPATRGAGAEIGNASKEENAIDVAKGIKVYVFTPNGVLETAQALTLTENDNGTYTSSVLEVTSGERYIYVFANDGRAITKPEDRASFLKTAIATAYTGDVPTGIATFNNFLIGTLWSQKTTVAAGGTADVPVTIELGIGRLASKVRLIDIAYVNGDNSGLNGIFSDGKYRLGALALKIYNVGICGENALPTTDNVLVTSCLHNTPYDEESYLLNMAGWKTVKDSCYVTENTTAPDAKNQQYWGNTTFVQIETKYTPATNEIYNVATGETGGALTGGTFWTGIYQDKRLIFNDDPTGSEFFPGVSNLKKYVDGLNYHMFPVYDKKESEAVKRNRVLRNHYYEYKITKFNDLGSPENTVTPGDPIPTKSTVEIVTTVLPWSKVTSEVEVG